MRHLPSILLSALLLLPLPNTLEAKEVVAGPVAEAVAGPVAEAVAGPVAEAVAGPVLGAGTGRLVAAVAGPVAELHSPRPPSEGWIEGQVLGEGLEPVPGVMVELTGPGLPRPLAGLTDARGRFRLGPVPPGEGYRIRGIHLGYATRVVEGVAVAPGETTEVELRLVRQAVALDTLQVFTAPLRIRRDDTEFGVRLDARALELLPTPHQASQVAALTPGARAGEIWGGAAPQANLYQLDGMAQNHPGLGGAMVEPSMRWVERVEIRGLGSGAEFGDFQGGMVNVVTRSGSNLLRRGMRISVEDHRMNATNALRREMHVETDLRRELEGEASGPLVRDRLYYFVGGHLLEARSRAQGHLLPGSFGDFLPFSEDRLEARGFGKLTWEPDYRSRLEFTGGWFHTRVENAGMDGYQAQGATGRLTDPVRFWALQGERSTGSDSGLELRVAGFSRDELFRGNGGEGVPSVKIFAHGNPPVPTYQNAPFDLERAPSTRTAFLAWTLERPLLGRENRLRVGAEVNRGTWVDRRSRNGGMTWRPIRSREFWLDEMDTWVFADLVASEWGGEVDLNARLGSEAIFVQNHLVVSPRLSLSPGVRLSRWRGELLPGGRGADRFTALEASGVDPRFGVTLDPSGENRLVLKAHWGRYHQGMLSQFFDRVEGGEVYDDRELWYYRGGAPDHPGRTFTVPERDQMTEGSPRFTLEQRFRLNETGSVDPGYRHPHVDQWIAGVEVAPTDRIRAEALFVHRENRNLVALLDRNLSTNYRAFHDLWVHTPDGRPIYLDEDPLVLPTVWIPHDALARWIPAALEAGLPLPPGVTPADLEGMTWDQDLVLTNPEGARRSFQQLQLALHGSWPRWGGSVSFAWSRLRGNLNSVTGYEAGTGMDDFVEEGAGPWVRPNEQVNFEGRLPGVAPLEVKAALHGEMGWGFRGGVFWHAARGDRYTPHFTLNGLGFQFLAEEGGALDPALVHAVAGQRVFVKPRGELRYGDRHTLDLRVDRELPMLDGRLRVTLDLFNLWNSGAPVEIFREVNQGTTFLSPIATPDPNQLHGAVRERLPPRTFRIGLTADF